MTPPTDVERGAPVALDDAAALLWLDDLIWDAEQVRDSIPTGDHWR